DVRFRHVRNLRRFRRGPHQFLGFRLGSPYGLPMRPALLIQRHRRFTHINSERVGHAAFLSYSGVEFGVTTRVIPAPRNCAAHCGHGVSVTYAVAPCSQSRAKISAFASAWTAMHRTWL